MINWHTNTDKMSSVEFDIENAHIQFIFSDTFLPHSKFGSLSHNHSNPEIFFVKRGECAIQIDGKEYFLGENSCIAVPAGTEHHVCLTGGDSQIYTMKLQFCEIQNPGGEIDFDVFGFLNRFLTQNKTPHIFCAYDKIFGEIDALSNVFENIRKPLYKKYFECVLTQFFIDVIYCMNEKSGMMKNDEFPGILSDSAAMILNGHNRQFYSEIVENFLGDLSHKKISLPELAERLGLSERHTSRLIKQIYNVSFTELFGSIRIMAAKSMLAETDLSVDDIAETIGYSYKGFLRTFQKMTGKTPAKFKKMQMTEYRTKQKIK